MPAPTARRSWGEAIAETGVVVLWALVVFILVDTWAPGWLHNVLRGVAVVVFLVVLVRLRRDGHL